MLKRCLIICLLLPFLNTFAADRDNESCGISPGSTLANSYGPWDYTKAEHQEKLPIVIRAHFTKNVANLTSGHSTSTPHGDIDYTLRAIPNYHPALFAVSKLERRDIKKLAPGFRYIPKYYSADCYFRRAVFLQPKDHISHMLYAIHLQKLPDYTSSLRQYHLALSLKPKDPEVNYNLGLLYVKLGEVEKAEAHATIAYDANHPLPGLKNKIIELKHSLAQ